MFQDSPCLDFRNKSFAFWVTDEIKFQIILMFQVKTCWWIWWTIAVCIILIPIVCIYWLNFISYIKWKLDNRSDINIHLPKLWEEKIKKSGKTWALIISIQHQTVSYLLFIQIFPLCYPSILSLFVFPPKKVQF